MRYNEETEVSEMERIPRAIYTKEVREEAVKLLTEGGLSIPEVGRRLSLAPSTREIPSFYRHDNHYRIMLGATRKRGAPHG